MVKKIRTYVYSFWHHPRTWKNRRFHVPQRTFFVSPGNAPATIMQYVAWMERQFNACQSPRSMYLYIFNSFRVIRCLSQCVNPKIAIFTTFLFLLETPLGQSRCVVWMKRECIAYNCLAACTHLSSTVSQLFELQVQKITVYTFRSPHFCFPWRRPCDYHAVCCTDGKQFNAWQTPRSMYLSIFNSFRVIRCLSQCVSPKIAIFTTFLFPLGTPLGQSREMLYGWKENSMLTYKLSRCMCPSDYKRFWDGARYLCGRLSWLPVSFLLHVKYPPSYCICEKVVILSYPLAFDAPVRGFPSEYRHPFWYGKN